VTRFIVNIPKRPQAVSLRVATVHKTSCRYAQRAGLRRYVISADEVLRLAFRVLRGDGGRVRICQTCRPDWTAARKRDAT
jgi:hypothetical protein